ncbi:MAG: lysophospholipid acyltransferase family protein [Alphaproteobacteria bacterium]|nr:lysophospholipid acyltransferase family protein [Alphaproteobacteria bacterium]
MRGFRRVLRSDWLRGLGRRCAIAYIRLVWRTGRWVILGQDVPGRLWDAGQPFIIAFWHGRLLMMPACWRTERTMRMLISRHRDGELIARVIAGFGLGSIRGSSREGAGQAIREMVRAIKAGECVGITPDGPRGPARRASDGAVAVARLTDAPILPAAYSAWPARQLASWDGFLLPLPFCRGVIAWGQPIEVPAMADPEALEACRLRVENELNELTERLDRMTGREPDHAAPRP